MLSAGELAALELGPVLPPPGSVPPPSSAPRSLRRGAGGRRAQPLDLVPPALNRRGATGLTPLLPDVVVLPNVEPAARPAMPAANLPIAKALVAWFNSTC